MDLQEAKVLFNQGIAAYQNNDFDLAIQLWNQIEKRSDEPKEVYARAQYNLGCVFQELKHYQEAEQAYKNVSRQDSAEYYSIAQNNLGNILSDLKRFDEAEKAYNNVTQEDSSKHYAWAQFNLGILLQQQQCFEEAEQAFKNVIREDAVEIYAQAQFNLGNLLREIGREQEAERIYRNIQKEDSLEAFERAQKALSDLQYQLSIQVEDNNESGELLNDIHKLVDEIKKLLLIDFDNSTERCVAHYTRVETAKFLTNTLNLHHKLDQEPSYLRLNPIDFMNDPTEGQLLLEALNLNEVEDLDILKLVDHSELKPFIACFTLHHDSLNQFRLYGKTDAVEASGISLVLEPSFFTSQQDSLSEASSSLSERIKSQELNGDESFKAENEQSKEQTKEVKSQLHLPLYRCIYWDPESSLVEIANVERWAFWRLNKGNDDANWQIYAKKIADKEKRIAIFFKTLRDKMKELFSSYQEYKDELIEQVLKIILPLRYLVKHFAYREEQECRVLHLTKLDNENIVFTPEHKLYLDYRSVLPSLEKIYLAAGALEHKTTFEYLLAQAKKNGKMPIKKDQKGADQLVKVSKSHNPFRALKI